MARSGSPLIAGWSTSCSGRQDGDGPVRGAVFVVVSGPPGSGKSTVAPAIAARLGLPLVAKDTVKEELMSVLPVPTIAESRRLGRAAVAAMLAVAASLPEERSGEHLLPDCR